MAEQLWNSPELVRQFEAMAIGDGENVSGEFLGSTEPRHARALKIGVDDLLDMRAAYQHSFSRAALNNTHHQSELLEASVERDPETGAYTFVTMMDRPSIRDMVGELDIYGSSLDLVPFGVDMDVPRLAEGLDKLKNPAPVFTRITTVVFDDPFLHPQRITEMVSGRYEPATYGSEEDRMTVYDFMNLGRMIEVDLTNIQD